MTGPSVVIVLPFEGRIRVRSDCLNDGEEARLLDGLAARPHLAELVDRACELAGEGLAA